MIRSSKNPGNTSRKRSSVIDAMIFLEGRFLPSIWLMPPARAYERMSWSAICVTVGFTAEPILYHFRPQKQGPALASDARASGRRFRPGSSALNQHHVIDPER